jgi:hypothetical protein
MLLHTQAGNVLEWGWDVEALGIKKIDGWALAVEFYYAV